MPHPYRPPGSLKRLLAAASGNHSYNHPRQGFAGRLLRLLWSKCRFAVAPYLRLTHEGEPVHFYLPTHISSTSFLRLWENIAPTGQQMRAIRRLPKQSRVFMPIPIHGVEELEHPERLLATLTGYFNQPHIFFLFDLSSESVCFDPTSRRILQCFEAALRARNFPFERVLFLSANASGSFESVWHAAGAEVGRVRYFGYHYYVYDITRRIVLSNWFRRHHSALLEAAKQAVDGKRRPKHFMALNLKSRPHRTALLLKLLEIGAMEKGIVTYIGGGQEGSNNPGREVQYLLQNIPEAEQQNLNARYGELQALCPLTFERTAVETTGIWTRPQEISRIIPEIHRYGELRIDSYFEIVTETYFTDDTNLYITEKTLRPILRFQPFLHIGAPFVLRELRRMGFRTFAPFIDESYDEVTDPPERMRLIFAEIERLCALPIEELHTAYVSMWEIFEHNFHHLHTQIPALFMEDVGKRALPRLAGEEK